MGKPKGKYIRCKRLSKTTKVDSNKISEYVQEYPRRTGVILDASELKSVQCNILSPCFSAGQEKSVLINHNTLLFGKGDGLDNFGTLRDSSRGLNVGLIGHMSVQRFDFDERLRTLTTFERPC